MEKLQRQINWQGMVMMKSFFCSINLPNQQNIKKPSERCTD